MKKLDEEIRISWAKAEKRVMKRLKKAIKKHQKDPELAKKDEEFLKKTLRSGRIAQ